MRTAAPLALIAAAALAGCDAAPTPNEAEAKAMEQVVVLESSLVQLREDFNAAQGDARLVFIAGPNCPGCLRGLADMQSALADVMRTSDRLHIFVVFVPQLQAQERHARQAVRFFDGDRVRHYWDPSGATGERFKAALGIDQYAWDVWMTYAPDALWTEDDPPAPSTWMHQLYGLPSESMLDPQGFAAQVRALLESLT